MTAAVFLGTKNWKLFKERQQWQWFLKRQQLSQSIHRLSQTQLSVANIISLLLLQNDTTECNL